MLRITNGVGQGAALKPGLKKPRRNVRELTTSRPPPKKFSVRTIASAAGRNKCVRNGRLPFYGKFLDPALKFPAFPNIFPVNLSRELSEKCLRRSSFRSQQRVLVSRNRDFPCKIPCYQGIGLETGAISTASPGRESRSNLDIPIRQDLARAVARLLGSSSETGFKSSTLGDPIYNQLAGTAA